MEYSIRIFLLLLFLLLFLFLFVAHMSHPLRRRFLTEGFEQDYSKPSVDLTTEPDFMGFYNFHIEVCKLWNAIIDKVMENDCHDRKCPDKETYIKELQATYQKIVPDICFISCEKIWDANSSLDDLLEAIPENIKCYRGSLTYISKESARIIMKLKKALAEGNISGFADYHSLPLHREEGFAQIQSQTQSQSQAEMPLPPEAKEQLDKTNKIIGRCRVMTSSIPALKQLMDQAKNNIVYLKGMQKKAESGELLPS